MRKFGLIGFPLAHSYSQKYFTEKFAREQITDCSYENFPLESIDHLPELLNDNSDLCGLNVTIPYKNEVLNFINVKEPVVDEIGAANVLKIKRVNDKTQIYGFNSDIVGIMDSIQPFLTDKVKNALVFGTGGSSGAVSWVLRKLGINVILVSRKRKPGIINYQDISQKIISRTDLIVNTTPLGMFPDISTKPEINYDLLNEKHILFDLVYNPEITSFLKEGKERGCKIITGLKMLYSQADRSWEIWNNDNL
ncbi:MAG: shikimate dehydrogenase [Bacteroidia bacterium]|nr:shikimate dehydrogenase [Bacteroidia bacterium]